ncbi:MAG: hemerythrin domain-containing protein, partial [Candidatus Berkelbacteria bacterium]
MDPIKELNNEHLKISKILDILEIMVQKMEKNIYIPKADMEDILYFSRLFTDKLHHTKEEDGLFAEMFQAGYSKEKGPVAMMLLEHYSGHHCVRN